MNAAENAIEWERRMKQKYDQAFRRKFGFEKPTPPELQKQDDATNREKSADRGNCSDAT